MKLGRIAGSITLASALMLGTAAFAETPNPQNPQSVTGPYRGMYVCQKVGNSPDILHVPIDLVVRGGNVEFARPLFNWNGRRVVGNEMAVGALDPDGKVHLTSHWDNGGVSFQGDYSGMLTPSGGTLMGTQTWHGAGNINGSRTCAAGLVQAGEPEHKLSEQ